MSREYPRNPIIGVGALVVKGGKILLVKRRNDPGRGLWSIPGGCQRVGESLEDAAIREVKEETGVSVKIVKLLEVRDYIVRDRWGEVKCHYVLIDFLAKPLGGELEPSSDVEDARWVSLDDASSLPLTEPMRDLLLELKKRGLKELEG